MKMAHQSTGQIHTSGIMACMSDIRVVPPVHAFLPIEADPDYEIGLAAHLKASHAPTQLLELYDRFSSCASEFHAMMRRVLWRALVRKMGHGARIGQGVRFSHPETFEIGDAVFIGDGANIQGRFDGYCHLGNRAWIGPQSFLDARALSVGNHAAIGPGARVLGSEHTGQPPKAPVMATDLVIRPVRIGDGADIGVGAILMPGITVGEGAIVGAGSVVNSDVQPFAVVAGTPARFLRSRDKC